MSIKTTPYFDPNNLLTPHNVLNHFFQYPKFRNNQKEAINTMMTNENTIILLPTNNKKSLCFQIPNITMHYLKYEPTLIISPLIALIKNQIKTLVKQNIPTTTVHNQQSNSVNQNILTHFTINKLNFLYVSPEQATLKSFHHTTCLTKPALLTIDEAHYINQ